MRKYDSLKQFRALTSEPISMNFGVKLYLTVGRTKATYNCVSKTSWSKIAGESLFGNLLISQIKNMKIQIYAFDNGYVTPFCKMIS